MAIFGWTLASMLMLLSLFPVLFLRMEANQQAEWDAVHQDWTSFYAYSNYVRHTMRQMQDEGTMTDSRPCYLIVYDTEIPNAGSGIDPQERKPVFITEALMDQIELGNVLGRDSHGLDWLYVWMDPGSSLDRDARIKRAFERDKAIYYIKQGDRIVYGSKPNESREIVGGVADAIPDGAIVFVSQPIEHGPTAEELAQPSNMSNGGIGNEAFQGQASNQWIEAN